MSKCSSELLSSNDRFNRRQEAVESYQKAIALDPDYYETYQELGTFYFKRGEYLQAVRAVSQRDRARAALHPAYTNLGGALTDWDGTTKPSRRCALHLSIKTTAGALNNLAAGKAYQKRDLEAIDLYKKAYALDPHKSMYLMNLGDSTRRAGLTAESEQYYRKARDSALKICRTIREADVSAPMPATWRHASAILSAVSRRSNRRWSSSRTTRWSFAARW